VSVQEPKEIILS